MEENLSLDLKARVQCSALQKGEGIEGSSGGGGGPQEVEEGAMGSSRGREKSTDWSEPLSLRHLSAPNTMPLLDPGCLLSGKQGQCRALCSYPGHVAACHPLSQASEDELSAYLQSDPGMARLQQQQTVGGLSSGAAWSPDPAVSARRPVTGPQTWGCSRRRCRS